MEGDTPEKHGMKAQDLPEIYVILAVYSILPVKSYWGLKNWSDQLFWDCL